MTAMLSSPGASSSESTRVALSPSAGFCIKTLTTDAGFYNYTLSQSSQRSPKTTNLLEPTNSLPDRLQIPKGVKVFLNIAWDKQVPPPPPADEAVVRRAMMGEDLDDALSVGVGEGAYYVPVVVSEPREDIDKAGKPSVVFDCVFNASLRSRCTKDREFRLYLIELALEHVEEKAHLTLSRQIGTPNIASKGKLESRTALIPNAMLSLGGDAKALKVREPLAQEIPSITGSTGEKADDDKATMKSMPKSILKSMPFGTTSNGNNAKSRPLIEEVTSLGAAMQQMSSLVLEEPPDERVLAALPQPRWQWSKDGERLRIEINVPQLTRALHEVSTLDIESRRLLLHIPRTYFLDINLALADAEIGRLDSKRTVDLDSRVVTSEIGLDAMRVKGLNAGEALRLKRQRDFDVGHAHADWRVGERKIIVWL